MKCRLNCRIFIYNLLLQLFIWSFVKFKELLKSMYLSIF